MSLRPSRQQSGPHLSRRAWLAQTARLAAGGVLASPLVTQRRGAAAYAHRPHEQASAAQAAASGDDTAALGPPATDGDEPREGDAPRTADEAPRPARIAITLDLEMSRNFPTWEATHWDYEKGNLDQPTKEYALEAARRVARRGAAMHLFVVGRVCEQPQLDWLAEIAELGHRLGNHTYDHVNVTATRPEDVQFRFQRAPWLIADRTPEEAIAENIRLTEEALRSRLGIAPCGFRTPGGFHNGLADRPDVQRLLAGLGYRWVSSKYPAHEIGPPQAPVSEQVFASIVAAQAAAQPFVYPEGLVEIPMSPASDITAFRSGRWALDDFLEATRRGVAWAIAHGAVYDFLGHPSCLLVTDPEFRAIDLICDLAAAAGPRARLVTLDEIAAELAPGAACAEAQR